MNGAPVPKGYLKTLVVAPPGQTTNTTNAACAFCYVTKHRHQTHHHHEFQNLSAAQWQTFFRSNYNDDVNLTICQK